MTNHVVARTPSSLRAALMAWVAFHALAGRALPAEPPSDLPQRRAA